MRTAFALALVAGVGCQPADDTLRIRVSAGSDVEGLRVVVSPSEALRDPESPRFMRVARSAESIAAEPIEVMLELASPTSSALVHLAASTRAGELLVATRCYPGAVFDEVQLVGLPGALDLDGDGFVADPSSLCREPTPEGPRPCDGDSYLCEDSRARDCNEGDPSIYPTARTICMDGVDQDCDGMDEPCADNDGDGFAACSNTPTGPCDCDDTIGAIHPGATDHCEDGLDQDCDGVDAPCD